MSMKRYVHKTAVIEAVKWDPNDLYQCGEIMGWFMFHNYNDFYIEDDKSITINVEDRHRTETIKPGSYIVRTNGTFHAYGPYFLMHHKQIVVVD